MDITIQASSSYVTAMNIYPVCTYIGSILYSLDFCDVVEEIVDGVVESSPDIVAES